MPYQEVNFDGLIGPSHNYAGLSLGNLASGAHQGELASPREAALQGLEKMWRLVQRGQIQGVFPPACRPDIDTLRKLGFRGPLPEMITQAYQQAPHLLAACYSASSMWAANAATVSASQDSSDNRLHFTPANLITTLHRSIETQSTANLLKRIFNDPVHFCHHPPLPLQASFADEGAANHTRLCAEHSQPGITLLVYGRGKRRSTPQKFPARQTQAACQALMRQHNLPPTQVLLAQQNPEAIDQGVFHHDVIGVGHRHFLMLHEQAFVNQRQVLKQLQQQWQQLNGAAQPLIISEIDQRTLSVKEAVSSYLFNSQLISLSDQTMLLLAPANCLAVCQAKSAIEALIAADNPVSEVEYIDLAQSMNNGGGPACLRLRVPLSPSELKAVHPHILLDENLYRRLKDWIKQHYRDQLKPQDLADPCLANEIYTALDELTDIIKLPKLYPFQV
ncbi:N-succinylarginine dihydrolase [Amphritea sp. 1_MG-2023]|uniref:N-succinylarginine dihydrolase n=1 Tax=Amphritea sp. 1_MG-2023 TaxID=3062670 RepID=UPI0026E12CFD|nr:N-succinylarginine dihydrolase [Amphritea sp. 1_MG-2023]MDO6564809.1 N-succinylarginine dihydrolase [Amphritea sp. 1_MG-2023]